MTLVSDQRRFQVFVSSTFLDLVEERQAVIAALLECDAFPAGMELFPAADDDAWTLIKKVIDECDYYLLVIGGKYGSVDPDDQLSYTEKEFDYAVSQGKPVMAFVHGDPTSIPVIKAEMEPEKRNKLDAFRTKVTGSKHVKYWTSTEGLAGQVALTYNKFVRLYEAVGWVRADGSGSPQLLAELSAAQAEVARLSIELAANHAGPPEGAEELAQGEDEFTLPLLVRASYRDAAGGMKFQSQWIHIETTWNFILRAVGPKLYDECDEEAMRRAVEDLAFVYRADEIRRGVDSQLRSTDPLATGEDLRIEIQSNVIDDEDFGTILTQLKALGFIEKSVRKRSVTDKRTYWALTNHGDRETVRLCAIRRGEGGDLRGSD